MLVAEHLMRLVVACGNDGAAMRPSGDPVPQGGVKPPLRWEVGPTLVPSTLIGEWPAHQGHENRRADVADSMVRALSSSQKTQRCQGRHCAGAAGPNKVVLPSGEPLFGGR